MNEREKRGLIFVLLMFGVYFVPFMIYPAVSQWVESTYDNVQQRKAQVKRLQRLIGKDQEWRQEHTRIKEREQTVEAALLPGNSQNLIATYLQDSLRTEAGKAKLKIRSLEIAEFSQLRHWLLVSQSLRFQASSQQLYDFTSALNAHPTLFKVVILNVQVGRKNQLEGSLTVTGISHVIIEPQADDAS